MRVKICGITKRRRTRGSAWRRARTRSASSSSRARRASSRRRRRAAIIAALPPFVTPVGIFWDHAPGHVKAVAEECGLGALQFHGDERRRTSREYRLPVIKTLKVAGPADLARMARYRVAAFLLDSPARWSEGEARPPISWERGARTLARRPPHHALGRAHPGQRGGGDPRRVRPYAVDVDSGVEARPGRKDPDKVRRFVAAARRPRAA